MTPTLLARYANQRVPRYTSYPTAPHFRPEVGSVEYGDWLADLPEGTVASLYLHVPFCRSMCWYCGCHTRSLAATARFSTTSDRCAGRWIS